MGLSVEITCRERLAFMTRLLVALMAGVLFLYRYIAGKYTTLDLGP